jgi:hypothetical protein
MKKPKSTRKLFDQMITGGGVDAILASMFQNLMLKLGINTSRFQQMITRYVAAQQPEVGVDPKDIAMARSYLKKDLTKGEMTWRVFCKGIGFLGFPVFTFTVVLHHDNMPSTSHAIQVVVMDDPYRSPPLEKNVKKALAHLFRKIMLDLGIRTEIFNRLMEQYLMELSQSTSASVKSRASARRNLHAELLKDTMTWRVFCKGMKFLNIPKFIARVTVTDAYGDTVTYDQLIRIRG